MQKLIIKTAAITLGSIVALMLILWGIFALFSPGIMAKIYGTLGLDGMSAVSYARLYDKTGDIDDLNNAVLKCYFAEKYDYAKDYGAKLVSDDDFEKLCKAQDAAASSSIKGNYRQYVYGIYCVSLFRCGEATKAIDTAFSVNSESFDVNNAVIFLVLYTGDSMTDETLEYVGEKLAAKTFDSNVYRNFVEYFESLSK